MDVLTVGGKEYVKASVIARDLGYTADYVGQLCRSHRVRAKLVGRSWYVDRESIANHKTNRYRSTQTKAKESLREEIKLHVENTDPHTSSGKTLHFYRKQLSNAVSYTNDESELIPHVKKEGHGAKALDVRLADAVPVQVVSEEPGYKMDAPSLPEIKFKGSLTVTEVGDGLQVPEGGRLIHPKDGMFHHNRAKNIDKSSKPKESDSKLIPKLSQSGFTQNLPPNPSTQKNPGVKAVMPNEQVLEEGRMDISLGMKARQTAHAKSLEVEYNEGSSLHSSLPVLVASALSVLIVIALLGLESSYTVSGQSITVSYRFALDHLAASVYTSVEEFDAFFDLFKFSTNFFIF